jgi:preprotein translocase subunit SecG
MYLFVLALHIVLCFVLMLVIILQPGKGGDGAGGLGGGAAAAIFGPQGPTNLLQRITSACAMMFMVTSITLAWYSSRTVLNNSDVDQAIKLQEQKRKDKEKEATPEIVPGATDPALQVEPVDAKPADAPKPGDAPKPAAPPTP